MGPAAVGFVFIDDLFKRILEAQECGNRFQDFLGSTILTWCDALEACHLIPLIL